MNHTPNGWSIDEISDDISFPRGWEYAESHDDHADCTCNLDRDEIDPGPWVSMDAYDAPDDTPDDRPDRDEYEPGGLYWED